MQVSNCLKVVLTFCPQLDQLQFCFFSLSLFWVNFRMTVFTVIKHDFATLMGKNYILILQSKGAVKQKKILKLSSLIH